MKYIVFSLLLLGCSSFPQLKLYQCSVIPENFMYGYFTVLAPGLSQATQTAHELYPNVAITCEFREY